MKNVRYTTEQKEEAKRLIQQGVSYDEIVNQTGVAKSTLTNLAKEVNERKVVDKKTDQSPLNKVLSDELKKIDTRQNEIKELLSGKLQQELDTLEEKRKRIQAVIDL